MTESSRMSIIAQAGRDARTRQSAKSPSELIAEARLDVGPAQEGQIQDRLSEMPQTCRMTYLKAMRGKSMAAGIKAFCQACLAWDSFRTEIPNCTDLACPLYCYRPYRARRGHSEATAGRHD